MLMFTLQGKKVATLPAVGKEWTITFDLQPSEIPTANKQVLLLSLLLALSLALIRDAKRKCSSSFTFHPSLLCFVHRWYGILTVANSEGDVKAWKTVGNRNPGVFYHGKNKKILVRHFIGKEAKNLEIDNKEILVADKPTSFKISQEMEDGKLMYKVNQLN